MIMTLRVSDLQSDSDLDSIRNSSDDFFCSLSSHFEEQTAEKSRFLLFMLCVEINFPGGIYATP